MRQAGVESLGGLSSSFAALSSIFSIADGLGSLSFHLVYVDIEEVDSDIVLVAECCWPPQ